MKLFSRSLAFCVIATVAASVKADTGLKDLTRSPEEIFEKMDANNDGIITKVEFVQEYKDRLNIEKPKSIKQRIEEARYDLNKDGKLSPLENALMLKDQKNK